MKYIKLFESVLDNPIKHIDRDELLKYYNTHQAIDISTGEIIKMNYIIHSNHRSTNTGVSFVSDTYSFYIRKYVDDWYTIVFSTSGIKMSSKTYMRSRPLINYYLVDGYNCNIYDLIKKLKSLAFESDYQINTSILEFGNSI